MTPDQARARARELAHLNAFISLTEEGGSGPAVAIKDLVDVRDTVTTAGGVILPTVKADRDAPVISRIRASGAAVMGKASLHEFAYGATSSNPHYGPVRNPHDPERVAGGSSGGSAVAVATGMCDWALGTDTGGSIRIPASFCGVVGIKPTVGSIDTEGVIPLSRTLDTLGPLAPDMATAARALEAMSDLRGLLPERRRPVGDFRLATPGGWTRQLRLDETTATTWARVAAELPEVNFPDRERMHAAGHTILLVEAYQFHARWMDEVPDRYGADVLALLRQGAEVPRERYVAALLEQAYVRAEAEATLSEIDALLVPVAPYTAPLIGQQLERGTLLGFTRPFNTTGHPVIALPAPSDGLPVGIQVVGRFGRERELVEVAMALEAAWR
ncbi:MAG TPA: amidase [Candidatus Dormibacteraeota bacterium]